MRSAIDAFQADDNAFFQAQRSPSPVAGPSTQPARQGSGNRDSSVQPSQRRKLSAPPTRSHPPKSTQPKKTKWTDDDNSSNSEDEEPSQRKSTAPPKPTQPKKKQQADNDGSSDDEDVQPRRRTNLIAILEGEEAEEERDEEDYDFDPNMEVCGTIFFLSSCKLTVVTI